MEMINTAHSIQPLHNVQSLQRSAASNGAVAPQTAALKDSISFSDEALRLNDLAKTNTESPRIRFDLVNRIKAEIATGAYDTQDKMDIAIDRMANRIF